MCFVYHNVGHIYVKYVKKSKIKKSIFFSFINKLNERSIFCLAKNIGLHFKSKNKKNELIKSRSFTLLLYNNLVISVIIDSGATDYFFEIKIFFKKQKVS